MQTCVRKAIDSELQYTMNYNVVGQAVVQRANPDGDGGECSGGDEDNGSSRNN